MRDRKTDAHRAAGERKAGRKLGPNEIVHHKDENKDNNAPDNLVLVDRAQHTASHNRARSLSRLRRALRVVAGKEKRSY